MLGKSEITPVRALAGRIGSLHPKSDAQIANVGLMAGALYALERAVELGYDDTRSAPNPNGFAKEFREALGALSRGSPVPDAWLSGFYFHSAIMRLAALNERLDRAKDVAAKSRNSVNSLKHEADAHISGRRTIAFAQALKEAEDLCTLLFAAVP